MSNIRVFLLISLTFLTIIHFVHPASAAIPLLASPPLGDRWFSINFNGERTGFATVKIAQGDNGGYEVSCEASVKMVVLGFSREASSREWYKVNRDLSLSSFRVEEVIDGTPMKLSGEAVAKGIRVRLERGGKREEKMLKSKGAVYPSALLNVYPLMHKAPGGKSYRVSMLDIEEVKVKDVKITLIGEETLADGTPAIHFQNDLYSIVDNDIWVDRSGNALRESVRDGLIVTASEDRLSSARFLVEAAVSKRDLLLDFSLVRLEQLLDHPATLSRLVIELAGIPGDMPLLQGAGQQGERLGDGRVRFTMVKCGERGEQAGSDAAVPIMDRYRQPSPGIPSADPEIIAMKEAVVGAEKEPGKVVELLARWVAANVAQAETANLSALDALRSRKGNCQSHVRLYIALARAAGIPTRYVSGLVYPDGKGFLYHSWAESLLGGWVPVDPTNAQVPVDVTHIKLVEGEAPDEMLPLARVIGRVTARIVEQQ